MYVLTIGDRKVKFKNKACAMRWSRDQAAPYVPEVCPDDIKGTLGVGTTYDLKKTAKPRRVWQAT